MKKTNILFNLFAVATFLLFVVAFASCKKPADGADGAVGPQGPAGADANESCKLCHNATVVEAIAQEYDFSKHFTGLAAEEEVGRQDCAPCHLSEGFKYVSANNTPATFTLNTTTNKYVNNYTVAQQYAIGAISCFTCHSHLHTTYGSADLPSLTSVAPVSMTFFGGAKEINLTQDAGISNLCVKCHQPRPMTQSTDGNVFDYATLLSAPTAVFYDSTVGVTTNKVNIGYRTGGHYGSVGAIFAGLGKGGLEIPGTVAYLNSKHTTEASCQDCHMATRLNAAGGHTFIAKGNLNGCNVTDCHGAGGVTTSATDPYLGAIKTEIKGLLNTLASDINALGVNGQPLLHSDATETNLWLGATTGNYDGYFNIYSSSSTDGYYNKTGNRRFPTLTNIQMAAILNFQFCLREYSLGIHNYKYVKALLTNSIAAI